MKQISINKNTIFKQSKGENLFIFYRRFCLILADEANRSIGTEEFPSSFYCFFFNRLFRSGDADALAVY